MRGIVTWGAAVLVGVLAAGCAWAAQSAEFWHDAQARVLPDAAPRPSASRRLILDRAGLAAYLQAGHVRGGVTRLELPRPEGGFAAFEVMDSGTMSPELAAKHPDILSFKGHDATGNTVRVDVSSAGVSAMVFDASGVWIVAPATRGGALYQSYRRNNLLLTGNAWRCETPGGTRQRIAQAAGGAWPTTVTGDVKRTYRLAVAANNRYISAVGGGTVAGGIAAVVTAINRVNQIYESELAIHLQLIGDEDLLMYPSASNDPFASNDANIIYGSTNTINQAVGAANYDIGHVFTTGSGGMAWLDAVCDAGTKGGGTTGLTNPTGDAFYVDYVAHEIGHQFGANHTFNSPLGACNGNGNSGTAYEPGSGSTIMAYAGICGADDLQAHSDPYFHAASLAEIETWVSDPNGGGACGTVTANPNHAPVIDTASLPTAHVIPVETPFQLAANATDPDAGNHVTYAWEEWDLGAALALSGGDNGESPILRSWPPATANVRTFPALSVILGGPAKTGETLPTTSRDLDFRLTVRDQSPGDGTSRSADVALSTTTAAGPFIVTAPTAATNDDAGDSAFITWNVANTDQAPVDCSAVNVRLSTDGGQTWPWSLVTNAPNTGSAAVTWPPVNTSQARVRVDCATNVFFNVSPGNFTIFDDVIFQDGFDVDHDLIFANGFD